MIRWLLRPRSLLSIILGALLLAGLLAFGDVKRALKLMESFQLVYLLYFLLLMALYEALRCTLWHRLLCALEIRVPLGEQVLTFLIGEVTKILPIGNYVPDYLLQHFEGTDFGLASAATTLIVLIEVAVSLMGVVVLGVDGWTWLRPLIVIGVAVFAVLLWATARWERAPQHAERQRWRDRLGGLLARPQARFVVEEVRQFVHGSAALLRVRVLIVALALGVVYLVAGGAMLYVVVLGLGIHGISFAQTLSAYFFSLAFALIVPIPVDIGVTEASGTGVFLALGVSKSAAVSVMLLNRVLSVGAALALALLTASVLRAEMRTVRARRGRTSRGQRIQSRWRTAEHPAK